MNILFGRTDIKVAGPGIVMLKSAQKLQERGHKVVVASSGGGLHEQFLEKGVNSIVIPSMAIDKRTPINLITAIFALREVIKSNGIDVVHGHNLVSTMLMFIAGLFNLKILKVFTTVHGVGKERFFNLLPGKLIAVSQHVKKRLAKSGVPEHKIEVIYNGFINLVAVPTKKAYFDGAKPLKLVSVAKMTGFKGHKRIIDAFYLAQKKSPGITLSFIGDGPEKAELLEYVKKLNLENKIYFLGVRFDVLKLLPTFDVFIHAPDYETFGMVVLEAMSVAQPVITVNVGGIPELINSEEIGIIAENTPQKLSEAIIKISSEPEIHYSLGKRARQRAEVVFDSNITMDRYEALYQR